MPAADPLALRLTPKAEEELEDIRRHGAQTWSPAQADRPLGQLVATLDLLAAMSGMARERAGFTPPVRIHPLGAHLVVYRVEADHLLVIRVLGARQDWRGILERLDG